MDGLFTGDKIDSRTSLNDVERTMGLIWCVAFVAEQEGTIKIRKYQNDTKRHKTGCERGKHVCLQCVI